VRRVKANRCGQGVIITGTADDGSARLKR